MAAHEESLPSMVGVRVACHERLVFRKLTTELARDSGPGIAATWECPNLEHLLAVEVVFRCFEIAVGMSYRRFDTVMNSSLCFN